MYFDNCLIIKQEVLPDLFYILWLFISSLVKILWNVNEWMNEWINTVPEIVTYDPKKFKFRILDIWQCSFKYYWSDC
jgi:hypothetical protein